jgi:hypothetical protein
MRIAVRIQAAIKACELFIAALDKNHIEFIGDENDRAAVMQALERVDGYVGQLRERLKGGDAPKENSEE